MSEKLIIDGADNYISLLYSISDEPYQPDDYERLKNAYRVVAPFFKQLADHELEPEQLLLMTALLLDHILEFNAKGDLVESPKRDVDLLSFFIKLLKNVINSEMIMNSLDAEVILKFGEDYKNNRSYLDTSLADKISYQSKIRGYSMQYAKTIMTHCIEKFKEEKDAEDDLPY